MIVKRGSPVPSYTPLAAASSCCSDAILPFLSLSSSRARARSFSAAASPPPPLTFLRAGPISMLRTRDVAVQVEFESKQTLKPVFHFIGSRVGSPGAFKLWVNCIQLVQPPPRRELQRARRLGRVARRRAGLALFTSRYFCSQNTVRFN
jgi:hypothetical protein